jgi:hypothetical protein
MRLLALSFAALLPLVSGCAVVYPEVQTPLRDVPGGREVEPAPPKDLFYIAFAGADVPELTRDGRQWHELGSKLPDPFAILMVNGKPLIKTNTETSTRKPTWADAPKGNFRIQPGDRLRVELWEASLVNKAMCVKDIGAVQNEWLAEKRVEVECESGAHITLTFEPARGQLGYGFFYEHRTMSVGVTRVFEESPAARAGLRPGDEIVLVGDRMATKMKPTELDSFLAASRGDGVRITTRRGGEQKELQIKEAAVYPLYAEVAPVLLGFACGEPRLPAAGNSPAAGLISPAAGETLWRGGGTAAGWGTPSGPRNSPLPCGQRLRQAGACGRAPPRRRPYGDCEDFVREGAGRELSVLGAGGSGARGFFREMRLRIVMSPEW